MATGLIRPRAKKFRVRTMLMPKKVKYRKHQRGRRGRAKGGDTAGLRRLRPAGARAGLDHGAADRGGPYRDHPSSSAVARSGSASSRTSRSPRSRSKPVWVKGKGNPEEWVAVAQARPDALRARRRFDRELAKEAMRLASHKLALKTRFVDTRASGFYADGGGTR